MDLPYWIHEDYFIFKPNFNGSITDHLHIIIKYNKLIFSNYCDLETSIEQINGNESINNFSGSLFNKPLADSFDKLINLTLINFGDYFNKPLDNSLDKLINLTYLSFGYGFNKPLNNTLYYLSKLVYLKLGCKFNQELNLPSNIKILNLNCNNQNLIDSLPNSVEQLIFGYNFDLLINNLPN